MMKIKLVYKIILFVIIYLFSSLLLANVSVKGVRLWPSPEKIRLVLDLSDPIKYKIYTLSDPDRVVIDIDSSTLNTKLPTIEKNKYIKNIRTGIYDKKLRIVLDLHKKLKPDSFLLKPNEYYGNRLVIDLEAFNKKDILALFDLDDIDVAHNVSKVPVGKKSFIVAIDPGHGGEDPGAIGPRGTREKNVVLKIGQELKNLINQETTIKAVLIRNADYYVGLRERMTRARNKKADLFISIHADAFNKPTANGASVFTLSEHGASSEAAKFLANHENKADSIGGVLLSNKSNVLASVLLDLSQTANKEESFAAAKYILNNMGKVAILHKGSVEKANFAVLKAPDVPSVLVETGFISNPKTEKLLRSSSYQKKIANSILQGIKTYFSSKSKNAQ